jgi:GT2 family glycosyltransferase
LELRALTARLRRSGRVGEVRPIANCSSGWEVRLTLPNKPLVSIIIPTAGKIIAQNGRDLDLVINCVSSIDQRSTYRHFEVILVDNGDISEDRREILSRLGCKFITYTEPVFNIPKKLNLGASEANGEFLLLMNDDMEIITREWIERMLEHFMKEHVGVVGGKLLYPNNTLQHVGVVHYYGNPDHVRRGFGRYDPGYFLSTSGVRNYSAVTGACTMVRSETYRSVAGYTETLPENFNDIDFCQKVRATGLHIVYTPHVELIHFESQSREPRLLPGELDYYQERWARETVYDPSYNECNLTVAPPTFVPVVNKRLL